MPCGTESTGARLEILAHCKDVAARTGVGACGHVGRGLSDCTPRIGIVSAFGAEADILLAQTTGKRTWNVNGKPFTTGVW